MAKIRFGGGGSDFQPLPESIYDLEIKEVDEGTSKTEKPQVIVKFEVVEGDMAGRTHKEWYTMTPEAAWRLENLAKAAGVELIDTGEVSGEGKPIYEFDTDELVGKFVRAEIKHRNWEGKTFANLGNRPEASKFTPAQAETAKAKPAAESQPASASAPAGAAPGAGGIAPRRPRPSAAS